MVRSLGAALALAFVAAGCAGATSPAPPVGAPTRSPAPAASATPPAATIPAASPPRSPSPAERAAARRNEIARLIGQIDASKLSDHLVALTNMVSRDPRHPGHANAVAYLREQLAAMGYAVRSFKNVSQGIPLESLFVQIGGPAAPGVLICAHYDSTADRTPGWRPARDPAPGADDNATGTAALLEYARLLRQADALHLLDRPVTLAFFDGEELFFKGSGAYVASLGSPITTYGWVVNIDMVGFNPIADRLDLIFYTPRSAELRDRVVAANAAYAIGVDPLIPQLATDGNTILDAAPFGLAGVPSVALVQRYGESDATFPGNGTFHTTGDTPDKVTNRRLWLKAAKLTLAVALELASADR